MEEDEYKSTYKEIASLPCVFAKALTNHQARCSLSRHFCLEDREGYGCKNEKNAANCGEVLQKLREKSIFVLKLQAVTGPLPHNKEIRVQAGGLQGLAKWLQTSNDATPVKAMAVDDISRILQLAIKKSGNIDALPFSEIIQSVLQFQGRRRRSK